MKVLHSTLLAAAFTAALGAAAAAGPGTVSRAEAETLVAAGWWECQDPITCDAQQSIRCEANFFGECWGPMPCVKCNLAGIFWQCGFGFWDHCVISNTKSCNQLGAIEGLCDQATCNCIAVMGGDPRACTGSANTCKVHDDP